MDGVVIVIVVAAAAEVAAVAVVHGGEAVGGETAVMAAWSEWSWRP